MANINCEACDELRQTSARLVINGFDDEMCTSLENDTGLSPSSGNNDCTDLHNLNDCLVGNMEVEVEAYDICDWKKFMKRFIPNVWTTLKAMICAICGIWTNIHEHTRQILALCNLINATIAPGGTTYGIFPRNPSMNPYRCGFIPSKNGRPALIDAHETTHNADLYTGVGLKWGVINAINCANGDTIKRNFWKPYIWGYELSRDIEQGDAIYVWPKSAIRAFIPSMSDAWWQAYTDESWTWTQHRIVRGSVRGKNIWLKLKVGDAGYSNDYLVMTFNGTTYPNDAPGYDALIHEGDTNEIRWG